MTTTHTIPDDQAPDDFSDSGPTDPPRCPARGDRVVLVRSDEYHLVGVVVAEPGFVEEYSTGPIPYYSVDFDCADGAVENAWVTKDEIRLLATCPACGDTFPDRGPVVCAACIDAGVCSICASDHRAYRCPEVSALWPRPRTARALLSAVCPECGAPMVPGLPRCAACRLRAVEVFDRDNAPLLAPAYRKALVQ